MNSRSLSVLLPVALIAAGVGYWLGSPKSDHTHSSTETANADRKIKYYQSPMHPWITSETPGRCTICGMELVPVYEGESGFASESTVRLGSNTAGVIGVQTAKVEPQELTRTLRVNGVFEIDHTRHRVLSARVPGRIEHLYVDQVGMAVEAGEPLATLYSPEMLTAQRVYTERSIAGLGAYSSSELAEARERLLDLGATADDLERLESTRELDATVTVRAPFAGTVVQRGERAFIGSYVEESDTLFELGQLSPLWFVFDAYEPDLDILDEGQVLSIFPANVGAEPQISRISFIDPNLDPMTRTARVRAVVTNPEKRWRHQQTAAAEITIRLGSHLAVPRSAVLFTRDQPLVFVEVADNTYQPRTIELGPTGDLAYAVQSGLAADDRVVTEAALILEGQAQLSNPFNVMEPMSHGMGDEVIDSAADIAALQPLVLAVADAAAALANDNLAAYGESLPAVLAQWSAYADETPDAVGGPLEKMINALTAGSTLKEAREPFEPFSTAVADLARQAGLHDAGVVHIFQCPMTPVLGKGRWVQRTDDLRNPFFGSAMLTCGAPIN